jgi:STE24 endopeptidase
MDADWMYSSYHYSHPILTERLKAVGWKGDTKVGTGQANGKVKADGKSEL